MILVLFTLVATACTTETTGAPSTVTQTVTDTKTASTETGEKPAEKTPESNDPQACTSVHLEAALAPGEWPNPETWNTAVVVTNLGPDMCSLDGASELRFFTGGDGRQLDVNQVLTDGDVPADLVVLTAGEQASMSVLVPTAAVPTPDCLEGGSFVDVILSDDEDAVSAEAQIPPVCGAVQVTSWSFGGAPGVAPN